MGTNTWSSQASNDESIRLGGLTIGAQYKFRITATNAAGTSEKSAEVVATPYVPPQSPTDLVASVTDEGYVTLRWKAPVNIGGNALSQYFLWSCAAIDEKCQAEPTIKIRNGILQTTTTFRKAPGTYTYYVEAANDAGRKFCADKYRCGISVTFLVKGSQ